MMSKTKNKKNNQPSTAAYVPKKYTPAEEAELIRAAHENDIRAIESRRSFILTQLIEAAQEARDTGRQLDANFAFTASDAIIADTIWHERKETLRTMRDFEHLVVRTTAPAASPAEETPKRSESVSDWNLFLDDVRSPSTVYPDYTDWGDIVWVVTTSADEALNAVAKYGPPQLMSLDFDLGPGNKTVLYFLKELRKITDVIPKFRVHSAWSEAWPRIQAEIDDLGFQKTHG